MIAPRRFSTAAGAGHAESPHAGADSSHRRKRIGGWGWVFASLLGAVLVLTFVLPEGKSLGAPHTDLIGQFVAWRAFAAESLRAGNFPLWHPFVYAGQPFLGGFQSALLYPLNSVFLILPLERALNFSVLAHLALLGAGVGFWARQRGFHPVAAAMAGFSMALSGVVFPHVYAGHLSNLNTMAWVPWAFAGLESWWRERKPAGLLLAGAAIAMQILAGQIQYVYFFGVAAGVAALVAMAFEPATRHRALLGVALACGLAALLAAAQVLPGLEAAEEGVRQGKLDFRLAGTFALPPENLFTAIAPGFFGHTDTGAPLYWGRCYWWEMSVYCGCLALFCAGVACWDCEYKRRVRADWLVGAILLALALGRHLPIYRVLYDYVPGIGQFRGMSKFTFPAVLFLSMAAAAGLDGLVRGRWNIRRVGFICLGIGLVLGAGALVLSLQPGLVRGIFAWVLARAPEEFLGTLPVLPDGAERHAAASIARGMALSLAFGGCLLLVPIRSGWRWVAVGILPLEMVQFVWPQVAMTAISTAMPAELRDYVASQPGDFRVLNLVRPNSGFLLGAPGLWGNDPGVLKRYAEFMTFSQGGDPNLATQNLQFTAVPRTYAMLRCRFAFIPADTGARVVDVPDPLPRALLVSDYRVIASRDALFSAMAGATFDPRRTVLLEQEPSPRPAAAGATGTVAVIASDGDSLTLEANATAPMILLITDLYAKGWTAKALPGSVQQTYDVLPANYILRAVPLTAGHHRLRLEYRPRTLTMGIVVSVVSALAWLGMVMGLRRRSRPAAAG